MNRIDVVFSNSAGSRRTTWDTAEALLLLGMRGGWLPSAARELLQPTSIRWDQGEPIWIAEARDEAASQRMIGHLYSGAFSSFSRRDGLALAEVLREIASRRSRPGTYGIEAGSTEQVPDLGPSALLEWADFFDARATEIRLVRTTGAGL